MKREKKLLINTIILGIGTFIPKLSSFIILPILTANLTKAEYGTYDLIVVLSSLLLPAVTLQLQTAGFRFLIECNNDEENKKKIISNIMLFILPISLISLLVLFFILSKYSILNRILIGIYFLGDVLYSTFGQIARGQSNNKVYTTSSIVYSLVNLFMTVLLIYFAKMGLQGVLICLCMSTFIPSVYMGIKIKILKYFSVKSLDKKMLKKLISYSWPMVPNSLSMWVMNTSDRIVITMFLGIEANAVYAVSKKIPNILTIAQSTFTMAWQESASLASNDKDAKEYYSKMFDTILCFMSAIYVLLIIFMPLLFKILVRGDYAEAYNQMTILIAGMYFFSISSYLGGIYIANMKTKSVGITTFIAAIINLLTSLILINSIGIYAASISTLISYIFLSIYRMIDVNRFTKLKYNMKKIFIIVLILFCISLLSYFNNLYVYIIYSIFGLCFSFLINKEIISSMFNEIKKKIFKGNKYEKKL